MQEELWVHWAGSLILWCQPMRAQCVSDSRPMTWADSYPGSGCRGALTAHQLEGGGEDWGKEDWGEQEEQREQRGTHHNAVLRNTDWYQHSLFPCVLLILHSPIFSPEFSSNISDGNGSKDVQGLEQEQTRPVHSMSEINSEVRNILLRSPITHSLSVCPPITVSFCEPQTSSAPLWKIINIHCHN